jgi:hypothetical protein
MKKIIYSEFNLIIELLNLKKKSIYNIYKNLHLKFKFLSCIKIKIIKN